MGTSSVVSPVDEPHVCFEHMRRQPLERLRAKRRNHEVHAENAVVEPHDYPVVRQAVDRAHEPGAVAEDTFRTGPDTNLPRDVDREHGGRPSFRFEMPGHGTGQEHCRRTKERTVDDLEVRMCERERRLRIRDQWPKPEPRLRFATGRVLFIITTSHSATTRRKPRRSEASASLRTP